MILNHFIIDCLFEGQIILLYVGFFIYFAYGVRHSHPTDESETDVLLDEKE